MRNLADAAHCVRQWGAYTISCPLHRFLGISPRRSLPCTTMDAERPCTVSARVVREPRSDPLSSRNDATRRCPPWASTGPRSRMVAATAVATAGGRQPVPCGHRRDIARTANHGVRPDCRMGGRSLLARAACLADAAPGVRPVAAQLGQRTLRVAPSEACSSNRHVPERRLDAVCARAALARCVPDSHHGKRARLAVAAPRASCPGQLFLTHKSGAKVYADLGFTLLRDDQGMVMGVCFSPRGCMAGHLASRKSGARAASTTPRHARSLVARCAHPSLGTTRAG